MNSKMRSFRRIFTVLCLSVLLLALAAPAESPRVVAIGDVHGAYAEFVGILQRMGLIDANLRWTGGSTIFVQTGDMLDRGKRSRECLDLLMDIESQAEKGEGRVIPLLGNHEAMNIMGDLRYVTPEIYGTFASDESEKVRDQAYQDHLIFLSTQPNATGKNDSFPDEAERKKWMDDHPLGYFEYRDAFGPNGKYGRWLRGHHAIVQIGDVVFVHGGLNPTLQFCSVTELDDRVRSELTGFDSMWQSLSDKRVIWRYMKLDEAVKQITEVLNSIKSGAQTMDSDTAQEMAKFLDYKSWMSVSRDGPLWFRGLALDPEEKWAGGLDTLLEQLGAHYIVDGHTVLSNSEITPRFDNRVFIIDTGMLKEEYGGRASALEILGGKITAFYADGETKILVAPSVGKIGLAAIPAASDRMRLFPAGRQRRF
jgi:hypothetical protein